MRKPEHHIEIFLHPGEYYWGDQNTRIRTILGSCVTLTAWHPQYMVGGMTHIIVPERAERGQDEVLPLNAKYAQDAIMLLMSEMKQYGPNLQQFQLKLFGGGDMFAHKHPAKSRKSKPQIGEKNIEVTQKILKEHKLSLHSAHVGGQGHRAIVFDLWSGYVWVKHISAMPSIEGK